MARASAGFGVAAGAVGAIASGVATGVPATGVARLGVLATGVPAPACQNRRCRDRRRERGGKERGGGARGHHRSLSGQRRRWARSNQRHAGRREAVERKGTDLILGHVDPEIIHTLEIDLVVDHFLQRGRIDVRAPPNSRELGQRLLCEREVLALLIRSDELGEILVLQGLLVEADRSRSPVVLAGDAHRPNRG